MLGNTHLPPNRHFWWHTAKTREVHHVALFMQTTWSRKRNCYLYRLILPAYRSWEHPGSYFQRGPPLSVRRLHNQDAFLPISSLLCKDTDFIWKHAEGMNEKWEKDMSKVGFFNTSYYFKLLKWPLRVAAAAYSITASWCILPWSQTTIMSWRASERAEESVLYLALYTDLD